MDETRSIIDRDIDRLQGSIRNLEDSIQALKSRRNALSPISRLPVEILCNIFSLSILCSPVCPESWTNFSQVSHHWRSLALGAPELWTNIPLRYSCWAQEMLIRSKRAKLTIRSEISFATPQKKTIETTRSCLYEMNRVEAIDIFCGISPLILEEIFRDLPKSAPQLRTLCIKSCYPGTPFLIGEDFLDDTERLQHVDLLNCKISWGSRLLTGLTRLTLEIWNSSKANSSINQFLHALQRMPALTELCLKDSIPDDSEGLSTYPVVDLPCLRLLNISSGVGSLTTVLRHITFPHSTILSLTCKEKRYTEIDFTNFLSVLATKFLSSFVFRSLSLRGFEIIDNAVTHALEFCFWTTANIRDCLPFSDISQSQLQLVLTWSALRQPERRYVKALTSLLDAISFSFLTQLKISNFDYFDTRTWVKTFGKLPLLERVCIQSNAINCFLDALVYKTKAAEKSITAYRSFAFPKLRYISLEDTNFDYGATSFEMLLDCLVERNAKIQELRLDRCRCISPNDVAKLKGIVDDVIWDGADSDGADSDED